MRSRVTRYVLFFALAAFFISACAGIENLRTDGRPCKETHRGTIELFLEGMREMSLTLIKLAIPESWSAWAIFGGGSITKGQINVHNIVRYAGAGRDDNVGVNYDLVEPVKDTENPSAKIVTIERTVEIIRSGKKEEDAEYEVYRRSFRVTFVSPTNCITDVQAIDSEWIKQKT